MKKCKFRRTVCMVSVWILVTMLLMSVPVMAFADFTVFDPYEHGTVTVDGDRELVHVQLDTSRMLWRRFHDGTASVTATGSVLQYSTQMRYLDNDQVNCTVLGPDFVKSAGIPTGSTISGHMNFGVNIQGLTQTYGCTGFLYLYTFNSTGSLVGSRVIYQEDYSNQSADIQYSFDYSFSTDLLRDSFYWELDFVFDFYGVANESDTAKITLVNYGDDIVLDIPYSQVYQLQQQGIKTNKLLDQIDKQMAANGEKLDNVIAQGKANAEKLDQVISGGSAGEDLNVKDDQMSEAGDNINEGLGDIQDFEDQYMGQLEDNLPDIIAAADFSLLAIPLTWVQYWLNRIVGSIPSTYLIVFTLPMLFGLVMFILGHPIRAPRPDTSGDIVTRETFTTSTVLAGPKAGRSTTVRTVTQSREIGRVHGE